LNRNKLIGWLKNKRVAVLKGGWSRERSISLKTGAAIEAAFRRMKIPVISIDVKKNIAAELKRRRVDLGFIALHGAFGEDGEIQRLLASKKILFTGSPAFGSAVAMDKNLSKRIFVDAGVPTPAWMFVRKSEWKKNPAKVRTTIEKFLRGGPLFIKPHDQGSAIGAARVESVKQIEPALRACWKISSGAMIERFVKGRELTVGVLGNKALPVVEILPKHAFYDFHSKYAKGGSRHVAPARLPRNVARNVQRVAVKVFKNLSCAVYGRVDVLLDEKNRPFVLEANTIPGMTATSLLPDAARANGMSFDDLVLAIVDLSLTQRAKEGIRRA
jgi:D-alanine-D-alanine ligase